MPDIERIEQLVERKTYITGKFEGNFIGHLNLKNSDFHHENFYDLEIIRGKILIKNIKKNLRPWSAGEPEDFENVDIFPTKFPDFLNLEIKESTGETNTYQIALHEIKLKEFELKNQTYENNKVYGDITGIISGYIKHYETFYKEVEVKVAPSPTIAEKVRTNKRTGKKETVGDYVRWEYLYSDNSTFWGPWEIQADNSMGLSFWEGIKLLMSILLISFFAVPLLLNAWEIILAICLILGIIYLFPKFSMHKGKIFKWLFRVLGTAYFLLFVIGLQSLISGLTTASKENKYAIDNEKELSEIKYESNSSDSIISHLRSWVDYSNQEYLARIKVRVSDFNNSEKFRNEISIPLESSSQYNSIISKVYDFDKNKLDLLYSMLDSIRVGNSLDENRFATVIVSMIQDIPYTLILDSPCNHRLYNDEFISDYLLNGGSCTGDVKFGLHSPVEFLATLQGDCDTRTILLFTILNHYGYDVALMTSEEYQHSIIGINLPFRGISKIINGKRYVLWETTAPGFIPGNIPKEISNTKFWSTSLITNNKLEK